MVFRVSETSSGMFCPRSVNAETETEVLTEFPFGPALIEKDGEWGNFFEL